MFNFLKKNSYIIRYEPTKDTSIEKARNIYRTLRTKFRDDEINLVCNKKLKKQIKS
jgi:hypothetical protein